MQNGRFPCKIALHLKRVCCEASLCEYFQRQSCTAFTGLAKMAGGERPFLPEILAQTDPPLLKRRFPIEFARSALLQQHSKYFCNRKPKMEAYHGSKQKPALKNQVRNW